MSEFSRVTYQGMGEQVTSMIALVLAIVTTHKVAGWMTARYGICAPQWPAWLAFFGSFIIYLAALVAFIR